MKVLPLYLPHQGCAHQCIYCNQPLIVGSEVDESHWRERLHQWHPNKRDQPWEIAFYAGTFSALPRQTMDACFYAIHPYLQNEHVLGVRISTRPDRVSDKMLDYLKEKGVRTIELGLESMDDVVLHKSARGHTAQEAAMACERVKHHGFQLGIHLMCGLPQQDRQSWKHTIQESLALAPHLVRIAPTLVLRDTPLERLYRRGDYEPLSLSEAIAQCAGAYAEFARRSIPIARVGLALSDGQGDGAEKVVAGPWHPSLRHEVEAYLARYTIHDALGSHRTNTIRIHPKDYSIVVGSGKSNLSFWRDELGYEIGIEKTEDIARKTFVCNEDTCSLLIPSESWISTEECS